MKRLIRWNPYWLIFLALPLAMTRYLGDPYTVIKWIGVYFILFIESIDQFRENRIYLFKNFWIFVSFVLLGAGVLGAFANNLNIVAFTGTSDFFVFWILVFFFYQRLQRELFHIQKLETPMYLGLTAVLTYSTWQFVKHHDLANFNTSTFSSFFGNSNIVSEYIVFLLPLQISFLMRTTRFNKIFKLSIVLFSLVFLCLWMSRSAMICMFLVLTLALVLGIASRKTILGFGLVIGLTILARPILMPQSVATQVNIDKSQSAQERWSLLVGGWQMLLDHPLGLGGSQYLFHTLPYQRFFGPPPSESVLYKSPHNDILRIGIEYGVLGLAGLLLFCGSLLSQIFKLKLARRQNFLALAIGGVVFVQALFQFPTDNAFTFVYCALILAWVFKLTKNPVQILIRGSRLRWIHGVVIITTGAIFSAFSISKFAEFNFRQDVSISRLACLMSPGNWRAYAHQIEALLRSQKLDEAREVIQQELDRRPFDFVALKFFTIAEFEKGNVEIGCKSGWLYDELFLGKSSWHQYLDKKCPAPQKESWGSVSEYREAYLKKLKLLVRASQF